MTPSTEASPAMGNADQLARYTYAVLHQMAHLVQTYVDGSRHGYAEHAGPHMRHIIEHYETLDRALNTPTAATPAPVVDYDARERDPLVESRPDVALGRIERLQRTLGPSARADAQRLSQPVEVHVRGGVEGEYNFSSGSTVARELMFLNSHATHHFAVLQGYAKFRGESLGPGLGKAPATVAFERQQRLNTHATA